MHPRRFGVSLACFISRASQRFRADRMTEDLIQKEHLYLRPAKRGLRLGGAHEGENQTHADFLRGRGTGPIDWPRRMQARVTAGGQGPDDLGNICRVGDCAAEYCCRREFIARHVHKHKVAV